MAYAALSHHIDPRRFPHAREDWQPTDPDISTILDGNLLYNWAAAAQDPAAEIALWTKTGAPAGITEMFKLDRIFAECPDTAAVGALGPPRG